MPNISLGTVYRNLKTLTEMGEILELSYGSTYSRFDGNAKMHYHFVCEHCGKVYDPICRSMRRLTPRSRNNTV